jgi:NADPH2:quinone reductase
MGGAYRFCLRAPGGIEVLQAEAMGIPRPADGEILIRHEAIGLNFIDTYHRSGLYPVPLPSGLGVEAAGVVEAVGAGAAGLSEGNRIGYFSGPLGAYTTHRVIAASRLVKLPDSMGSGQAAAIMLKGCTAEMLIERCAKVQSADTVLVHAAAGGVGSILVPWLKAIGATVIAHAGSAQKAIRAEALGADHSLSCGMNELAGEVQRLTSGRGAQVVLDGVGAASWAASLGSVAKRGMIVSYGNASGPVPPVGVLELARAGSVFLTRPTLFDYVADRAELEHSAARLFEMVADGVIEPQIGARYPLREAAEAHRALEARETVGSTILLL